MELINQLGELQKQLRRTMREKFQRSVSFGDLFTDRWERAKFHEFGEGSSCYDNVLIIGDVKVGKHTWIGPNVVLDGSGGLEIGDYCSISAGVQIYTHHTVRWATSMGQEQPERASTKIGSGVYIGPQAVIQMGVTIGDRCVIGAMSLVNRNLPDDSRAWGTPARIQNEIRPPESEVPSPKSDFFSAPVTRSR
ncbi:MAG: DapH/DapD/GlmU-related protein [Planctomycetaceae bacterium]